MANPDGTGETTVPAPSPSFSDFPEDVQLCILSFLSPSEISAFASTSKRFLSLCKNDAKLWFSLCHRRWGSVTDIRKWGSGQITFKHLYKTLHHHQNLIGFWRRTTIPNPNPNPNRNCISKQSPPLVFEWGPSFITASRLSPSATGDYKIVKSPFLRISISPTGEIANFIEPNFQLPLDSDRDHVDFVSSFENELIPVNVNHLSQFHLAIEENVTSGASRVSSSCNVVTEETLGLESGSPPDRLTSEIYQYFANRTSPGGETAWRRRRRREKERLGKKRWEDEHFVKIVNCSPTPLRPLQGLWKGVCEEPNLDFYLVEYDHSGGIVCRRVDDSSKTSPSSTPVFWTTNPASAEAPFSPEEEYLYETREHLCPPGRVGSSLKEAVSRILYVNWSYDLVVPELAGSTVLNPRRVEGRVWQYKDGTFGFGFLHDNHIVDLKHVALDGCLLDAMR